MQAPVLRVRPPPRLPREEGVAAMSHRGTRKGIFRTGHHDENHADIVAALSRLGPEPIDTTKIGAGFPDLVWAFQGMTILLEVKGPDGKLTLPQERFHGEWRGGPLYVIQDVHDIPKLIIAIQRPSVRRAICG
jgi:hypothetical protein